MIIIKRTFEIFQDQFALAKIETSGEYTKHLDKKWVLLDSIKDYFDNWKVMNYQDLLDYLKEYENNIK